MAVDVNNGTSLGSIVILPLKGEKGEGVGDIQSEIDLINTRIDEIIAPTGEAPNPAEIVDARIGATDLGGVTYSDLGTAIRTQMTSLVDELVENNSNDILEPYVDGAVTNFSNSGITFTRNGDKYTFSGTATRTCFVRYFSDPSSLPLNVKIGGRYYIHHKSKRIRLQIASYRNNSASDFSYIYDSTVGGVVDIPSNTTGLLARVVIFSGATVDETIEIPKLLTAPSNIDLLGITDEIKQLTVEDLLYIANVESSIVSGITFTCNDGVCTLNGTTTRNSWFRVLYDDPSNFPSWAEYGKTYAVKFEPKGSAIDGLKLQIAIYKADSSYTWICNTAEDTEFTIPNDTDYVGMNIRLYIGDSGTTIHATVAPKIYSAKTNKMLTDDLSKLMHSGSVGLIKDIIYYVRSSYDDTRDSVYSFAYPETDYNYTFNFKSVRLIDKNTPFADTITAYRSAPKYKDMSDDIPAFMINDVIVGSNHGNPNFVKCTCNHSLDESAIGTVWSDGTYSYTIVQVYPTYLIVGSLDENDQLVFRNPSTLTKDGVTLSVSSTDVIQLRRSAINRHIEMINDTGADISNGGGGKFIKIIENYDICDQSKMLSWLTAHAGGCTNDSYFDDSIPYKLASVKNLFIFNSNSTITVYGTLTARETITVTRLYGAMSFDFHKNSADIDYGYVPLSNEFATPTAVDYNERMNITPSASGVPYRFYQMTSIGSGKGHFLHLIDGLGDCDADTRRTLNPFAYFSDTATKLYLQVRQNVSLTNGKSLSWGYGRGIYKKTSNQLVNACFKLFDGTWIVSMDWQSSFSGYATLPDELAGGQISVIEKTNSVTVHNEYVGNNGIKVSCTGYGYCVLRIK